mmetsp:Transcript_31321/g.71631  ORF Transcript_31321/g.71631 Transcript_31321/m.71631 type:complete len:318 (-) Transcript_31321:98-1051(-)
MAASQCKSMYFPDKLHRLLLDAESDGNQEIVSFLPQGHAFVIKHAKHLEARILHRYFRVSCIKSFRRQLNLYGFFKIRRGADKGCYYHPCFMRNRPEKGFGITRSNSKQSKQEQKEKVQRINQRDGNSLTEENDVPYAELSSSATDDKVNMLHVPCPTEQKKSILRETDESSTLDNQEITVELQRKIRNSIEIKKPILTLETNPTAPNVHEEVNVLQNKQINNIFQREYFKESQNIRTRQLSQESTFNQSLSNLLHRNNFHNNFLRSHFFQARLLEETHNASRLSRSAIINEQWRQNILQEIERQIIVELSRSHNHF